MFTLMLITLYSLFGDDIRNGFTSKSSDRFFDQLMMICLAIFSLEVIVASIFQEDYFLGFYFWLDVVATLSIITDINWVFQKVSNSSDFSVSNA